MLRVSAIGLLLIAAAWGISQLNTQHSIERETPTVINVAPEAIPPVDDIQLGRLLAKAKSEALASGLESVSIQYYMWTNLGEWNAAQGVFLLRDPSTPILIISMPGTGFWTGPGTSYIDGLHSIDGVTVAYTPLDGSFAGALGSFTSLPF